MKIQQHFRMQKTFTTKKYTCTYIVLTNYNIVIRFVVFVSAPSTNGPTKTVRSIELDLFACQSRLVLYIVFLYRITWIYECNILYYIGPLYTNAVTEFSIDKLKSSRVLTVARTPAQVRVKRHSGSITPNQPYYFIANQTLKTATDIEKQTDEKE